MRETEEETEMKNSNTLESGVPENENRKQRKTHMGDNISMTGRTHVRGETHESDEGACERQAVETDMHKVHHTRVKGTERGKGCGKPGKGKV